MPEYYIQPVTNRQECFQCHKTVTGKRKFSKCSRCHAITYCGKECQVADWKRHSWNCVPVMVTEYEGKGRGLVAAKDVKMGELLFIDKLAIQMPLDKFGLPDSGAVDSLMKQIKKLPSEARKLFYQMNPTSDPFINLAANGNGSEELKILINNGNEVESESEWELFLNIALLNHSCAPNAFIGSLQPTDSFPMKRYEIRAVRDISKGEEVTVCYLLDGENIGPRAQRQLKLRINHALSDCKCLVCTGEIPDQEDLVEEYGRIFDTLKFKGYDNHYKKTLLDWKKEAMMMEKILDITPQLYIAKVDDKYRAYNLVAEAAQMARDPVLLERAMTMFKELEEETKFEEVRSWREWMQERLAQWSTQFKSGKLPTKKEIDYFEL